MRQHEYDKYHYEQGYKAYLEGKDIFACPETYKDNFGEYGIGYKSWMFGWNDAKQSALYNQSIQQQHLLLDSIASLAQALRDISEAMRVAADALARPTVEIKQAISKIKED